VIDDPSRLRLIRKDTDLVRIFPTLDLRIEEKTVRWYAPGWIKIVVNPIFT
jgi:hypothetical protein